MFVDKIYESTGTIDAVGWLEILASSIVVEPGYTVSPYRSVQGFWDSVSDETIFRV
jgi:hypothetical protein